MSMDPAVLSPVETSDVLTFAVSVIKLRIIKDLQLGVKPVGFDGLSQSAPDRSARADTSGHRQHSLGLSYNPPPLALVVQGFPILTLELAPGFILRTMAEAVHIGRAAAQAGVSVDTVRFYQKLGLIKSESRTEGGDRLFTGE